MIEIIGTMATVLAVIGVMANNSRLRWCFLVWMGSNLLSLAVHISCGLWSMSIRDAIFLVLAVDGWFRWGKTEST